MEPIIEKIELTPQQSFTLRRFDSPCPEGIYHYHPEIELTYVVNAQGKRMIGGVLEHFSTGELVMIGQGCPHFYTFDQSYSHQEVVVLHFREDFLGKDLSEVPEFKKFSTICEKARQGISFSTEISREIGGQMLVMLEKSPIERLSMLINIFKRVAEEENHRIIGHHVNKWQENGHENHRIDLIYSHVEQNYAEKITIEEVANMINMTSPSFCRFFKKVNRRSFIAYLNEYRVGKACDLLLKSEMNIANIAEEVGFQNMANFNRQFKKLMQVSPSTYRNSF